MPTIVQLTAHQIVEHVADGDLTRVEVVRAHLDRVDAANGAVGALVAVRADAALAEAAEADAAGRSRGPLDGVPVSVKAEYDVAGLATSHGNRFASTAPARVDSPVVARLRAQGAISSLRGRSRVDGLWQKRFTRLPIASVVTEYS